MCNQPLDEETKLTLLDQQQRLIIQDWRGDYWFWEEDQRRWYKIPTFDLERSIEEKEKEF